MERNYDKQVEKEKKLFLSLCSEEDRKKLTKEKEMSLHDFLRISHILMSIDLIFYAVELIEIFPELSKQKKEMEKRREEISVDYPDYCEDEGFNDKADTWLLDFCNQIQDEKQRAKFKRKLRLDELGN